MEIKKKTINGNEYTFICESWSNSRSWGHQVTLFKNNRELNTAKIRYYNRTWECYQYRTTMQKAVAEIMELLEVAIIYKYKVNNNLKRITEKRKNEALGHNAEYMELKELYNMI